MALAAAESLSDWLANALLQLVCPDQWQLESIVSALHIAGFVVERNSEWNLAKAERDYLSDALRKNGDLFAQCHSYLAELAFSTGPDSPEVEMPRYLRSAVGRAYHQTAISPQEGLVLYSALDSQSLGETWLAARLATEQQTQGIVPRTAIEPDFLMGMVLYREGRTREAMRILGRVAYVRDTRYEVAVSAHLYGRHLLRRHHNEALRLLRKSVAIGRELGNVHHEAQVLHTLGRALWPRNPRRAEECLQRSLAILKDIPDELGQAQVRLTLGQQFSREGRSEEAEEMLRLSVEIDQSAGSTLELAQALEALGQHLMLSKPTEAESLLRRSLALGDRIQNIRHQAIVSLALGKLLWPTRPDEARAAMLRSLDLNRSRRDVEGERIVRRELKKRSITPPAG